MYSKFSEMAGLYIESKVNFYCQLTKESYIVKNNPYTRGISRANVIVKKTDFSRSAGSRIVDLQGQYSSGGD